MIDFLLIVINGLKAFGLEPNEVLLPYRIYTGLFIEADLELPEGERKNPKRRIPKFFKTNGVRVSYSQGDNLIINIKRPKLVLVSPKN